MKHSFLLGCLGIALFAAPARADDPGANQTRTVKFTDPGHVTAFGYYVGTYRGVLVSEPGTPTLDLYCVDFLHHVSVGQQWTANFSNLAGDLTDTRYGNVMRSRYEMAAWLTTQYPGQSSVTTGNIQGTVWNLFSNTGLSLSDGGFWLAEAQDHYLTDGLDYSKFNVVTDVNKRDPRSAQEFLTTTTVTPPPTVTPEPATLILLGSGMLGVMLVGWKRQG